MSERPLISFCLMSYNQERFVRGAVEGALAQTYFPLEIVLSDDCSSDRSFEILREMAQAYRGPHKIILNRNAKNMRIGAHINHIMSLAHGEMIVIAAGDDVSLPHRTEAIHACWKESGYKVCSIESDYKAIDGLGKLIDTRLRPLVLGNDPIAEMCRTRKGCVVGAAHAWHRGIFETFGPFDPRIHSEDHIIPFRSLLLCGSILRIPSPLVLYRLHGYNISSIDRFKHFDIHLTLRRDSLANHISLQEQYILDLRKAAALGYLTQEKADRFIRIAHETLMDLKLNYDMFYGPYLKRFRIFFSSPGAVLRKCRSPKFISRAFFPWIHIKIYWLCLLLQKWFEKPNDLAGTDRQGIPEKQSHS